MDLYFIANASLLQVFLEFWIICESPVISSTSIIWTYDSFTFHSSGPMKTTLFRFVDTHCNIPNIIQKLKLPSSNVSSFSKLQLDYFSPLLASSPCALECEKIISVSSDSESQSETLKLIESEPRVYGAFGIHPLYAGISPPALVFSLLKFFLRKSNILNNARRTCWRQWSIRRP